MHPNDRKDEATEASLFGLKWFGDGPKYEFYLPKLYSLPIDAILAHCIGVRDTIEGELLNEYVHRVA
jgi:hypothetical protein